MKSISDINEELRNVHQGDDDKLNRKLSLLGEWAQRAADGLPLPESSEIAGEFDGTMAIDVTAALSLITWEAESTKKDKNTFWSPEPQRTKRRHSEIDDTSGARKDLLRAYVEPQGIASAIDLLEDGIVQLIKDSEPDNKMAPFLFLLQSMGYGKTRAMLELAKNKRRAVYLPCKKLPTLAGDNKFWNIPASLKEMLAILEHQEDENLCEIKWIKFLKAVQKTAATYETREELYQAQVTEDGRLGGFYGKLREEYFPSPVKSGSGQRSAIRSPEKNREKKFGVSIAENIGEISYSDAKAIDGESLVVCLDEATALKKPSFRAFRRAAKHLGIIVIFSDTTASISEIMPANDASSTIEGGELGHFTVPIYQIPNFDLEWNMTSDTNDLENLFRAGRPRWSSLIQGAGRDLNTLVKTVGTLLTRDNRIEEADRMVFNGRYESVGNLHEILPSMVAVFACRFGLGSRSVIAPLLAKYSLATVDYVADKRDLVFTHYPSEPVLAEASAWYTAERTKRMSVLNHVHAAVLQNLLKPPRGDMGEMCAAALLGFTMDTIRSGKKGFEFFSKDSVDLKEFLSVFGCKDSPEISDALEGWEVNFTHFVRPSYNLDHKDLEIMWNRRMAYYVLEGMKGLDLLIAMYHKEKGHATLRVQVKNFVSKFTDAKRMVALDKLTPSHCPPPVPDEKFSVGLLLCVGPVNSFCALVDYDDANRSVWPSPNKQTRQNSAQKKPKKLFLQIASSFPGGSGNEDNTLKRTAKKLLEICRGSETLGDWDVSRNSIERCKREIQSRGSS